jgi:hypothetical protein
MPEPEDFDPTRTEPRLPARLRRLAVALAVAIGLLGVVGTIFVIEPASWLERFDLDGERTVPAALSSLLLAASAAALLPLVRRRVGIAAILFAALLTFAALDEAVEIHERIEGDVDRDWQLLYLPGFAATAALWLVVLGRLPQEGPSRLLFVGSGAAWVAAQLLEAVQWDDEGPRPAYSAMMVSEEMLEMAGSAALLLALLEAGIRARQTTAPSHAPLPPRRRRL